MKTLSAKVGAKSFVSLVHFTVRFSAAILALALTATAQQPAARSARPEAISSVKFTGSKLYTQEQLTAATSLTRGEPFSEERMKAAAQVLADSGAFTGIEFRFTGGPGGVDVEFIVRDQPHPVIATFDNFVWFTPDQLNKEIRDRVPLYCGRFPDTSPILDHVVAALQHALSARGVKGRVSTESRRGPNRAELLVFRVEDANIRIANLALKGVTALEHEPIQEALKPVIGTRYDERELKRTLEEAVRPLYLAKGHLAVEFGEPQFTLGEPSDEYTNVNITVPVREGRAFRVTDLEWKGSTEFSAEELAGAVRLDPGKPIDATLLQRQLSQIQRMYRRRGYMQAEVHFQPTLNPDGTAKLTVTIEEGDQFRMGRLSFLGLDYKDIERLRAMWDMPEGDIYDATYPDRFFDGDARRYTRNLNYRLQERLDHSNQKVDLTVTFTGTRD